MQSWAWSSFKELEGYRVLRLGVFEDGRLRGGAVAYAYPSPAEAALVAVPDGPVIDWSAGDAPSLLSALAERILGWKAARQAVALRLEPRLEAPSPALSGLSRAPVDLVPHETLLIDLGPGLDMLARMRPKGRYNIRVAARRGVEVEPSADPSDVHEFHFVLSRTAEFQGFACEPKSFFINLCRSLFPFMGRFYFARYGGVTLAAALTLRHGDTTTFLYGGHLPLFREAMASYALHWRVMQDAAREGYRLYDLYGYVAPGTPEHPYDGFSRFKEKFGGRPVARLGSRDIVRYDRLARAAIGVMKGG